MTAVKLSSRQPGPQATTPSGKFAFVANFTVNNVSAYTINATTGALRGGAAVATGTSPFSVTTTGTIE